MTRKDAQSVANKKQKNERGTNDGCHNKHLYYDALGRANSGLQSTCFFLFKLSKTNARASDVILKRVMMTHKKTRNRRLPE